VREGGRRDLSRLTLVRHADTLVSLARRPVLFALARALGEAWPGDVSRDLLLARAFGARFVDESHRARLRVEIGRLRRMLRRLTDISATKRGFALVPRRGREVVVLARPVEEEHADVLAFLNRALQVVELARQLRRRGLA
jgi:DNA-binding winged helix-turn-helix (wHTH) protein